MPKNSSSGDNSSGSSRDDLYDEDIEKFINNVGELSSNVSLIARKLVNNANFSVQDLNERAKEYSRTWLLDTDNGGSLSQQTEKNENVEDFFSKPYQTRTGCGPKSLWGDKESNTRVWGDWKPWSDVWPRWNHGRLDPYASEWTPFGYYAFSLPSIRAYNDCRDKKGESVWDAKGYWHCLFPNSQVPAEYLEYKREHLGGKILTKEDFQDEILRKNADPNAEVIDLGDKGKYFRRFDDFLNWKSIMFENVRRENKTRREEAKKAVESRVSKRESLEKPLLAAQHDNSGKNVISTSVESSYRTDSETKEIVFNETRTEYYSDGTSSTMNVTKSKPFNSASWEKEESSDGVLSSDTSGKPGWFWNRK